MVTMMEFILSCLLGIVTAVALIYHAEYTTLKEKTSGQNERSMGDTKTPRL